jgi:hypothetical protein
MTDRTQPHADRRGIARIGRLPVAVLLAVGLLAIPTLLPVGGANDELRVTRQLLPLAFAEEAPGTWVSEPVTGRPTVAGLTWEDGTPPDEAAVRARTADGWTPWVPLELDDEHAPDPDTSEARSARAGSGPVIVEGALELQFRVSSLRQPRGLQVSAVRVDGSVRTQSVRGPVADAVPSRPAFAMRNHWGGDECLSSAGKTSNPRYIDRVQVMFVHHTATSNDYTADRAAAIVRSICDYHVRTLNYDDIAYNFLIDKFGVIYEGRGRRCRSRAYRAPTPVGSTATPRACRSSAPTGRWSPPRQPRRPSATWPAGSWTCTTSTQKASHACVLWVRRSTPAARGSTCRTSQVTVTPRRPLAPERRATCCSASSDRRSVHTVGPSCSTGGPTTTPSPARPARATTTRPSGWERTRRPT